MYDEIDFEMSFGNLDLRSKSFEEQKKKR